MKKFSPFKIAPIKRGNHTKKWACHHSEFLRAFGIQDVLDRYMPEPNSNRGYKTWQYIEPISLMLTGGEKHIERWREQGRMNR